MGTAASFLSPAPPAAETGPCARLVVVLLHSSLAGAIAGPAALQDLRAELPSPAKQEHGGCTKGCTRGCTGRCTGGCTGRCTWRCTSGCTWRCTGGCTALRPLQQKAGGDYSLPAEPLSLLQGSGGEPRSEQSRAGDGAATHRVIYPGPVRGTTFLLPLAAAGRAFQLKKVPG